MEALTDVSHETNAVSTDKTECFRIKELKNDLILDLET